MQVLSREVDPVATFGAGFSPPPEPSKPKLLILGHGRHGKDSVAEILSEQFGFRFVSSSLFLAERVMMPYFESIGKGYPTVDQCYEDRHTDRNRAIWYDQISAFNTPQKDRLCREVLTLYDMYVGMRCPHEYAASKHHFDYIIWVDATGRGVPPEGKDSFGIEYTPGQMIFLPNNGTPEELEQSVIDLGRKLI